MNLEEAARVNKYTMSASAVDIGWVMGIEYSSSHVGLMVTPRRIVHIVSRLVGVTPFQFMERTRRYKISHPRQVAMLLIREQCPMMSLSEIGRFFDMDHSSVIAGVQRARQNTAPGAEYETLYRDAKQLLEDGKGIFGGLK